MKDNEMVKEVDKTSTIYRLSGTKGWVNFKILELEKHYPVSSYGTYTTQYLSGKKKYVKAVVFRANDLEEVEEYEHNKIRQYYADKKKDRKS